jgi:hypothetical protein
MKKKSLLLTAVATLGLTAATMAQNVPSYVPTNGLVGWWPFNGNANDESGNGNNGTVNGATLSTDRFGGLNQAYNFNGISNYIDVGNPSSLGNNPSDYTQAGWLYLEDFSDAYVFMSKRHDNTGNDWGTPVSTVNGTFIFFADDAFYQQAPLAETNQLGINQWHHLAFVKNQNTYSIYVNGVLDGSITDNHIMGGSANNLIFGAQLAWPEFFKGKLDDIGVWNRALDQTEIIDLYNGCQLTVNTEPNSQTININNNAQFVVGPSDPSVTFQWQTDLGVGFQNLNSVGQYSGTTNDTLIVSNVTLSNNNQPFRCIISSGSCSDTSNVAVLTVNNNVGINQFAPDNLFSVYPNPAQTVINVKADSKLFGESYSVIDNTGRIVLSGKIVAEITSIELGNLSNGIYLFQVKDNLNQSFRIIKN